MAESRSLEEGDRLMRICNACRYCEGLCAVFPAMELNREFAAADLHYLANLCHDCGACYYDCQYAPPHEFAVNVPAALAEIRTDTYRAYTRPRALAHLVDRHGLLLSVLTAFGVAAFVASFVAAHDADVLLGVHEGPGAFYRMMPHWLMVALFGSAFAYALAVMTASLRAFWSDIDEQAQAAAPPLAVGRALHDAAVLRYLDGGGAGCRNEAEVPQDRRRLYHHLTAYGFLLCFLATAVATLYHYALDRIAPYAWHDLPVVLGTLGGLGLIAGSAGLLSQKLRRAAELTHDAAFGSETAFIAMLFLTALTGLLLLALRDTRAMGLLLALHLGVVFSFFCSLPHSKFVHGAYRLLALVKYRRDRDRPP